jgi:hypothetical protein
MARRAPSGTTAVKAEEASAVSEGTKIYLVGTDSGSESEEDAESEGEFEREESEAEEEVSETALVGWIMDTALGSLIVARRSPGATAGSGDIPAWKWEFEWVRLEDVET